MCKRILITGGSGFIGCHVISAFLHSNPDYMIYNLDVLTYAGNINNTKEFDKLDNYQFLHANINDSDIINELFDKYKFTDVIHLAAESHVDRSIENPLQFANTNIIGTLNLLNAFKNLWSSDWYNHIFYHISTDEVYGSLGEIGYFTEETSYKPNSPYSASKAASDHFVRAYGETYGLPYIISNCSNNYGPYQFPEKLIPLFINNIIDELPLPVYGNGNYTRDWLFVKDHSNAILTIFKSGKVKETYNIGGNNEWKNIDLVKELCSQMDRKLNLSTPPEDLIRYVTDRPGHDKRYAIDASKLHLELNWEPQVTFKEGLSLTIDWYLNNKNWLEEIKSKKYIGYNKMYINQLS